MAEKLKDQIYRDSLFDSFQGLDTVSALTNMQPGYLRIAKNCYLTEDGAVNKRQGVLYQNEIPWVGVDFITNGINYVPSLGAELVAFGHNGVTGRLGRFTPPSISNIITGLATVKPTLLQFGEALYFFNGVSSFLFDKIYPPLPFPNVPRQIGITAPTAAPTDLGDIAGSLVNTSRYIWVYTYYNSVTGAESSPSPGLAVVVTPSGGRSIGVTAGTATTADLIRLYRTVANGAILFLDSEVPIASTTISSTTADGNLGHELELDNTRITVWGEPRYAAVSQNRIFVTGFPDNSNRVRFSKIGVTGPMPESYQATGFADCESSGGYGDRNIGIGQANNTPIVLKTNSIGRLDQLGTINSELTVDNVVFEYQEISRAVTCASHWAQCNVFTQLLWMGIDNIYMTDGKTVTPIADTISNLIASVTVDPETMLGYNDIINKQVYFSAFIDSNNLPEEFRTEVGIQKWIFVGSYRKFPEFKWTVFCPGMNEVTHHGPIPGCFISANRYTYMGIEDTAYTTAGMRGRLSALNVNDYDQLEPNTIRGIYFKVRDYPTKFGLDEEEKLFFKDFLYIGANLSLNYSVRMYSIFDLTDVLEEFYNLRLGGEFGIWNRSLWDRSRWGYRKVRYEYPKHRKAIYEQIEFQNFNANEPLKLFGYVKCARPESFK